MINGMNNMMNMNSSMLNVPLAAQPFVRNSNSYSTSSGVREVSNIRVCFRVTDPYITDPISFSATSFISSGNQMELMNAYEVAVQIMQLCQQIKQGGAQINNGYGQPQQAMGGFTNNAPQNGAYSAPAQQAYSAPAQAQNTAASWVCASCGTSNSGKFCQSCGTPKPAANGKCPSCGWVSNDPVNMPKFCPECGTKL